MTTLLLLKEIYVNSFTEFENRFIANLLKVMSWFCFTCLILVFYAFFYRLFTGFTFQ
ncbi:DUF6747 family protein [Robertkochia aurantiaca]|uniref:DUF6747 family protein n=1 Tax=Robertkochia aurantiaca TaxID=2873700 RepID=UPI00351D2D6E